MCAPSKRWIFSLFVTWFSFISCVLFIYRRLYTFFSGNFFCSLFFFGSRRRDPCGLTSCANIGFKILFSLEMCTFIWRQNNEKNEKLNLLQSKLKMIIRIIFQICNSGQLNFFFFVNSQNLLMVEFSRKWNWVKSSRLIYFMMKVNFAWYLTPYT
jgi:hypothetical protein